MGLIPKTAHQLPLPCFLSLENAVIKGWLNSNTFFTGQAHKRTAVHEFVEEYIIRKTGGGGGMLCHLVYLYHPHRTLATNAITCLGTLSPTII